MSSHTVGISIKPLCLDLLFLIRFREKGVTKMDDTSEGRVVSLGIPWYCTDPDTRGKECLNLFLLPLVIDPYHKNTRIQF